MMYARHRGFSLSMRLLRKEENRTDFPRKIIYGGLFLPLPSVPPKAMKSNSESTAENQFLIKENVWEGAMCGSPRRRSSGRRHAGLRGASGTRRAGELAGPRRLEGFCPRRAARGLCRQPGTRTPWPRGRPRRRCSVDVTSLWACFQTGAEAGRRPCRDPGRQASGPRPLGSRSAPVWRVWIPRRAHTVRRAQTATGGTQFGVFCHTIHRKGTVSRQVSPCHLPSLSRGRPQLRGQSWQDTQTLGPQEAPRGPLPALLSPASRCHSWRPAGHLSCALPLLGIPALTSSWDYWERPPCPTDTFPGGPGDPASRGQLTQPPGRPPAESGCCCLRADSG